MYIHFYLQRFNFWAGTDSLKRWAVRSASSAMVSPTWDPQGSSSPLPPSAWHVQKVHVIVDYQRPLPCDTCIRYMWVLHGSWSPLPPSTWHVQKEHVSSIKGLIHRSLPCAAGTHAAYLGADHHRPHPSMWNVHQIHVWHTQEMNTTTPFHVTRAPGTHVAYTGDEYHRPLPWCDACTRSTCGIHRRWIPPPPSMWRERQVHMWHIQEMDTTAPFHDVMRALDPCVAYTGDEYHRPLPKCEASTR